MASGLSVNDFQYICHLYLVLSHDVHHLHDFFVFKQLWLLLKPLPDSGTPSPANASVPRIKEPDFTFSLDGYPSSLNASGVEPSESFDKFLMPFAKRWEKTLKNMDDEQFTELDHEGGLPQQSTVYKRMEAAVSHQFLDKGLKRGLDMRITFELMCLQMLKQCINMEFITVDMDNVQLAARLFAFHRCCVALHTIITARHGRSCLPNVFILSHPIVQLLVIFKMAGSAPSVSEPGTFKDWFPDAPLPEIQNEAEPTSMGIFPVNCWPSKCQAHVLAHTGSYEVGCGCVHTLLGENWVCAEFLESAVYLPVEGKGGCAHIILAFAVACRRGLLQGLLKNVTFGMSSSDLSSPLGQLTAMLANKNFVVGQLVYLCNHPGDFPHFKAEALVRTVLAAIGKIEDASKWSKLPDELRGHSADALSVLNMPLLSTFYNPVSKFLAAHWTVSEQQDGTPVNLAHLPPFCIIDTQVRNVETFLEGHGISLGGHCALALRPWA